MLVTFPFLLHVVRVEEKKYQVITSLVSTARSLHLLLVEPMP